MRVSLGRTAADRRYVLTLLICCLAALGAGLVATSGNPYFRTYDAGNYAEVARNILAGRGFSNQVVSNFYNRYPQVDHPEDRRPSSWSLVVGISLRLLGNSAFAVRLPNLLLGLLVVPLLVYFLGRAWRIAPLGAFAGAILLLFWPRWLQASFSGEADVLFTGLALLALLSIVARHQQVGWTLAAGALLGLSYTVKPAAMFLVAPLGLNHWLAMAGVAARRRAKWLAGAGLMAVVVASPMLLHNYLTFGNALYSTNAYTAGHLGFDDSGGALMHVYWDEPLPSLSAAFARYGFRGLALKVGQQLAAALASIFSGVGLLFIVPCLLVLSGRYAPYRLRLAWLALELWVVELAVLWVIRPHLLLPFMAVITLSAGAGGLALTEQLAGGSCQAALLFLSVVIAATAVGAGGYCFWHYQQYADTPVFDSYLQASVWLRHGLPARTVLISHQPCLVRFYSDHPVVQIPFDDPGKIERVMEHYDVGAVLVQRSASRPQWATELPRDEVAELARRRGWEIIYEVGEVKIYAALPNDG